MEKAIIIDITNSTVRIPSDFLKKFQRTKQHRKLKAKMLYDIENVISKETLLIRIEDK